MSPDDHAARHALRWTLEATTLPLAESLGLLRLVNLCQYRSRDADCGCMGHHCGIRSALVSHLDCLKCVECYGSS